MELEFISKINEKSQSLAIPNRIATLIGHNGSGKSSILEAIFEKYIEDDEYRIIVFSSGQNELFSKLFKRHKRENKRYLAQNNQVIKSFFFDPNWLKLLVFWSSMLKPKGKVRSFLIKNKYVEQNEFEDDISSKLYFKFRIRKAYVKRIKKEILDESKIDEEEGYVFNDELYRKTYFHETLEKLIEVFEIDFDFLNNENLVKRKLCLDSDKVFRIFTHKDIDMIFSFWALATNGWLANVDWFDFSLKFENNLDFHNLSDGEYQLLSLYSLIDLFDQEDTIFLLDEADSHLYYENLLLMWNLLHSAAGTVLTTTHLSDSILQNDFRNIRLVQDGKIEKKIPIRELSKRLNPIIGDKKYLFKILSRVEYPLLIDNLNDWEIFRKLTIKKIGNDAAEFLDLFLPLSVTSSYNSPEEIFGKGKLQFVEDFKTYNEDREIITKKIFLICDKDELPENQIKSDLQVSIHREHKNIKKFNSKKTKTFLLSWKRREIENYLLSPTLFEKQRCKTAVDKLYKFPEYKKGDNLDDITDFRNGDFKTILRPLYNDEFGFNDQKLEEIIEIIPPEEISDDIKSLFEFLKRTIDE